MVCLAPQLFFPVYLHANVRSPGPQATTLPTLLQQLLLCWKSSPPRLPLSTPPTGLDECFFFNSLVVGFPYSSIFWQVWLFFLFLNLLLSFLWLCKEKKMYLPMPPSWWECESYSLEIFKSCCDILHLHQQWMRVPVVLYPCQDLVSEVASLSSTWS